MEGPLFLSFTSTVFLCIWKVYFYLAIQPWPSLLCCILDSSAPASSPYPLSPTALVHLAGKDSCLMSPFLVLLFLASSSHQELCL